MTQEMRRRRLYRKVSHHYFGGVYAPRRVRREWALRNDARKGV